MSSRPKDTRPSTTEYPKLAPTKGKRKASCSGHDNPTPGPSSLPGMTTTSQGVGRQLAPKVAIVNPPRPPLVEGALISRHKQLRIDDEYPQHSSQLLQETHPTEQPIHLTNDINSQSNIPGVEGSLHWSNVLPMANISQGSEPRASATRFDTFSSLQNTSQAETASSIDFPSIPQITTIPYNFQMPVPQASVGYCPQCYTMMRNLRDNIIAFTCNQGIPGGGAAMGELWKSYFGLEDHWNERHVPGARGLAG